MAEWFTLDATDLDKLEEAILQSREKAGPVIDSVLHSEGAELITLFVNREGMLELYADYVLMTTLSVS